MGESVENRVHMLREQAGITQEQLATAVHVTRQTIIAIEKGHYAPSVHLALRIANFFNVSVDQVFFLKQHNRIDVD